MNAILIGTAVVTCFAIWKFIIQPRMNEDKPIEPDEDEETFANQLEKATSTEVDF